MARQRVIRNKDRYVLIKPCWALLVAEISGSWAEVTNLGPTFSSHVWSTACEAMDWPRMSPILGVDRCVIAGKKPSTLEK